jgi:galactokinase
MKALYDLLLESLELYLYAVGNLEAASRSSQVEDRERLLRSAAERLKAYLQLTGQPMEIALNSARESHGPLNMLTKINLRRLSRLMDRSRASVRSTLDATTPPARHIKQIPQGSQVTVKQASRSIEVICHAVAR